MRRPVLSSFAYLALGVALLAGCSLRDPAPSRADLISALEANQDRGVEALYVQQCRRAGLGRFLCGYEVTFEGVYPATKSACFYRFEGIWTQADTRACQVAQQ